MRYFLILLFALGLHAFSAGENKCGSLEKCDPYKANVHDKLILSLVPEGISMAGETLYETLLNSSCFVASLSDGKALRMAKDIGG